MNFVICYTFAHLVVLDAGILAGVIMAYNKKRKLKRAFDDLQKGE